MNPFTFSLILCCMVGETTEQLLYRMAGRRPGHFLKFAAPAIAVYLVKISLWYVVLNHLPIGVALPLTGANFVIIAIASRIVFGEKVDTRRWLGIILIVVGFALIAIHEK